MTARITHVTIVVPDYDQAIAFYRDALGFELESDQLLEDGKRWVVVRPGGAEGSGLLLARADGDNQKRAIGNQTGGRVGFFLQTDDFDGDHARMRAAGVRFTEAPRVEPYGKIAVFIDPFGNLWDLIQPTMTS